jgi:hypothetical protein
MTSRQQSWPLLQALVFGEPPSIPSDEEVWYDLVSLANGLLVGPSLARALLVSGLVHQMPDELAEYARAMYGASTEQNAALVEQTARVSRALNAIGITPLAFKGVAHLIDGVYEDPAERLIGDVDLLLEDHELSKAQSALLDLGYEETASTIDPETHWHTYPLVHLASGVCIELHRRALPEFLEQVLSADTLRKRSRTIEVEDATVAVPNRADALVLAALHSEVIDGQLDEFVMPMRALLDAHRLCEMNSMSCEAGYAQACSRLRDTRALQRFAALFQRLTNRKLLVRTRITDGLRGRATERGLISPRANVWLRRWARLQPSLLERLTWTPSELRLARKGKRLAMWARQMGQPGS